LKSATDVLRVADIGTDSLITLLHRFSLELQITADDEPIPGSFWGDAEAGIISTCVFARSDTPVHSVLHETCHLICANGQRRSSLHTDAGSDELEEAAVCYLQIVLADSVAGLGRDRLMQDMDSWGYSFRHGSSRAWFADDAADAFQWLEQHGIIAGDGAPSWELRD
jgi:hypothetical protein